MKLAPFEQVDRWKKTDIGLLVDISEVPKPDPVYKISINPKLVRRYVWATIEPYYFITLPQEWSWAFDVIFFYQNQETGRLKYSVGNSNFTIGPARINFFQGDSAGIQPTLRFRAQEVNPAGYSDVYIPCQFVDVVADSVQLKMVANYVAYPFPVNWVLAGFRILSQLPAPV